MEIDRRNYLSWARYNFMNNELEEAKKQLDLFLETIPEDTSAAKELEEGIKSITRKWKEKREKILNDGKTWAEKDLEEELQRIAEINIETVHKFLILCEYVASKYELV